METPTFQVVIVDDFAPWRNFALPNPSAHSDSWVLAETRDGPEAVGKALELQPDLILLDIWPPIA